MSAYATDQSQPRTVPGMTGKESAPTSWTAEAAVIDGLIAQLADRVAAMVVKQLSRLDEPADEWLDSRHAAEYLGVHRDTLRKLAAERAIAPEQDAPGCKLYFRRPDLDGWRHGGGRPRHLAAAVGRVA